MLYPLSYEGGPDKPTNSVEITLDHIRRTDFCVVGVFARAAEGVTLAEQIPALIELDLDVAELRTLVIGADLAAGHLVTQFFLLRDQVGDLRMQILVTGHFTNSRRVRVRAPFGPVHRPKRGDSGRWHP